MEASNAIDLSNLPACYSKKKTRKCSSCKCLKPMDQFLPIVINKKTVIPKTCQYCRSRRNSYYWNFESKRTKTENGNHSQGHKVELTPMKVGYLEKPAPVPTVPEVKSTPVSFSVDPYPKTSLKREAPAMDPLVDSFALAEPVADMDDDMNKCVDELHSMNDYDKITKQTMAGADGELPANMDVNDIIFEIQRQTVQNMMDELVNISDILAASQLDVFNNDAELPPMDDVDGFQLPIKTVV